MQGTNQMDFDKLRARARGVSVFGTLCGVFMALALVTGCPGTTPTPECAEDADCDDSAFCNGAETCDVDAGTCVAGEAPCTAEQVCLEETEGCVTRCDTDADCDDGNVCTDASCNTDTNTCVTTNNTAACDDGDICTDGDTCADGACAGSAIAGCCESDADCDAGQTCVNNECTAECDDEGDCDDGDLCTDDSCVNNSCVNEPVDCDDGEFCTGTETCDPDTGDCLSSGDPCSDPTPVCDEDADECVEEAACVEDADCDDGEFCNGIETCDVDAGNCVAGARPCDDNGGDDCVVDGGEATETCAEGDDAAVCTPCPSVTLDFTLGQDNLVGTTGDDVFEAPLEFNPSSGTQIATLQTGDSGNGLAGNDTLSASFNAGGTVVPQSIAGIEDIFITNFGGAVTLSATNVSGVNNIYQVSSVGDLSVTGLQELTDFGFKTINDTTVDLALTFAQSSSTSGTSDAITGTLEDAVVGNATVTTNAANGFETVNFASNGSTPNRLTTLTQTTGTTMATANFSGTNALQCDALPATLRTYDANAMSGNLQLGTGTCPNTGNCLSVYASWATANLNSVIGGSGNDTFIFGTTFDGNDFDGSGEQLDAGAGTDIVQATIGSTIGTQLQLKNIEELRVNATAGVSINLGGVTGLTDATIEGDGVVNAFTLLNVPGTPNLNYRGDDTQNGQLYDQVTFTANSATSASTLRINVNNRGTALNATGTTNVHGIGALTAANFGIVNIDVTDGPATFGGMTTAAMTTFDANASSNLTLGTVTGGATTNVDLSGVVGNFSGTFPTVAAGGSVILGNGTSNTVSVAGSPGATISITGGTGSDTMTGSAQADVLSGGDGNDTLTGGAAGDTLTGGAGGDVFTIVTETDSLVSAGNMDTVTDFLSGTDKFDVANVPVSAVASANADLIAATLASTGTTTTTLFNDITTINAAAAVNAWDQAGDTHVITLTGASVGGTNAVYVVIEDGTNATAYNATEDAVLQLGGTSSTTLTIADFQ